MTMTRRPLRDMVPELVQYVKTAQQNQTIFERKLLDIWEGGLQKYVEDSIHEEYSVNTARTAIERIAPINVLPKMIDKISQVYTQGVTRTLSEDNEVDSDMLGYYEECLDIDAKLNVANRLFNLFQYLAIEPYVDGGKPRLRILPPTQFTVYSDSYINPQDPTVFIKYMGGTTPVNEPTTDIDGRSMKSANNVVRDVELFMFYSDTEILAVDSEGYIRTDIMAEMGNPDGLNPIGRIPFVYVNGAEFNLIPTPQQDKLTMPILIPKLLTDLNYAVKFQSHAILYSIDLDLAEMQNTPDALWMLKSDGESSGSLNTIKPEVDVDKVLALINSTLVLWMETMGVKSSGMGNISVSSASSGIAKAIDEVDTTNIRKDQMKIFTGIERELWSLIYDMNEFWVKSNELPDAKLLSDDFWPTVKYEEGTVVVDPKQQLELLTKKLEAGFTSYRRALAEANPEMSSDEIDDLMVEIEEEKAERVLKAAQMFKEQPDDDTESEQHTEDDSDTE